MVKGSEEMIKHWLTSDGHYLCNGACGTTKEKIAILLEHVTCKNCLRKLKKMSEEEIRSDWMKEITREGKK